MKKFRIPRKKKKQLRGLWLYPQDEKGNSLMAHPKKDQKDYSAVKNKEVRNLHDGIKKRAKEQFAELSTPVHISDEELKKYVADIFREDLQASAYDTFLKAKTHPNTIRGYYYFVNAYHRHIEDESWSNTCCFALDTALALVKEEKIRKKQKGRK